MTDNDPPIIHIASDNGGSSQAPYIQPIAMEQEGPDGNNNATAIRSNSRKLLILVACIVSVIVLSIALSVGLSNNTDNEMNPPQQSVSASDTLAPKQTNNPEYAAGGSPESQSPINPSQQSVSPYDPPQQQHSVPPSEAPKQHVTVTATVSDCYQQPLTVPPVDCPEQQTIPPSDFPQQQVAPHYKAGGFFSWTNTYIAYYTSKWDYRYSVGVDGVFDWVLKCTNGKNYDYSFSHYGTLKSYDGYLKLGACTNTYDLMGKYGLDGFLVGAPYTIPPPETFDVYGGIISRCRAYHVGVEPDNGWPDTPTVHLGAIGPDTVLKGQCQDGFSEAVISAGYMDNDPYDDGCRLHVHGPKGDDDVRVEWKTEIVICYNLEQWQNSHWFGGMYSEVGCECPRNTDPHDPNGWFVINDKSFGNTFNDLKYECPCGYTGYLIGEYCCDAECSTNKNKRIRHYVCLNDRQGNYVSDFVKKF